ncbi:hypothetical protein AKJ63_00645 [candidate division MSBL1 archaeon SCGC-AAA259D18]|uniref:Uncharacterized protein n=2 Tax=candidate division MSBL1 TaxID=215777 RepID=A0A133UBJ4_9EURY|nr:hypothetical protein AKJ57_00695 [candidate division MSBL1 archaeon SCGC-AAA259A05]KXA91849.1 hypothetical protein AKJ63_00645 [candidate division MSBL1 archaeon SCGC-AAA259D18]
MENTARYYDNTEGLIESLNNSRRSLIRAFTLTRYSYQASIMDLERILENQKKVISEFTQAVDELELISDNYTLIYPFEEKRSENTLLDRAYSTVIENLESGGSISSAIESAKPHLENLSTLFGSISHHLEEGARQLNGSENVFEEQKSKTGKELGDSPVLILGIVISVLVFVVLGVYFLRRLNLASIVGT